MGAVVYLESIPHPLSLAAVNTHICTSPTEYLSTAQNRKQTRNLFLLAKSVTRIQYSKLSMNPSYIYRGFTFNGNIKISPQRFAQRTLLATGRAEVDSFILQTSRSCASRVYFRPSVVPCLLLYSVSVSLSVTSDKKGLSVSLSFSIALLFCISITTTTSPPPSTSFLCDMSVCVCLTASDSF